MMAITSQLRPIAALRGILITGWQAANLHKPSAIKPVFATIEQALILQTLGTLEQVDKKAVHVAIATMLG